MDIYPLIFEPIFKKKIWGGQKLRTALDKPLPEGQTIGESWEIADLEDDQSKVANGPARGKTLGELVRAWGEQLVGGAPLFEGRFPLLIKFLDAGEALSVQVHPDEAMARRLGGRVRVKHEAWYVIDAEGKILGRLATQVATLLMGKHKPDFTPFLKTGDFVVVVNAQKVHLTGKKETDKIYRRHSGYPGGLREATAGQVREKQPERLIESAVKGMLPKNKLGRQLASRLKVYAGADHPHQAQSPKTWAA